MNEQALKILDACLEAYDLYHVPKDGNTFCNFAVHHVCARMGYDKLKGMMANQMIDFLRRSDDWGAVQMGKAQALANDGHLLIAGAVAEPHGHVVIIRPGLEELSGKWNSRVPKACHVGGTSYIGRSLAWAFKDAPDIWMLKNAPDLAVVKA